MVVKETRVLTLHPFPPGTLKVDELQRVVIDGSHIDQKQRGIFDMKETHLPLLQLLTRSELRERYGTSKKLQIVVF